MEMFSQQNLTLPESVILVKLADKESNQIAEGFQSCSLIGWHSWQFCNQKLQELGKTLYVSKPTKSEAVSVSIIPLIGLASFSKAGRGGLEMRLWLVPTATDWLE